MLGRLDTLTSLTLRSVTLPDLSVLRPLTRLRALDLKLGGTRDLSLLPQVGCLEYLEIWQVRALTDLGPLGEVSSLENLLLQSLPQVTALPDMTRLTRLERVLMATMKGVRDLSPLAGAPALRRLGLFDMRHLTVDDIAVLRGHPTLREVSFGLGSDRKNNAATELLGLPRLQSSEPHPAIQG